jgi:type I restriction enzyme S subunit
MKEQEEIAGYLDKETQKIDDLKAKYRQEIDLIKEYKERLIYDVVTGKMKII